LQRRTSIKERHKYQRRKVHLPALAMACVVALGVTMGVPLAMQHAGTGEVLARSAPHTDGRAPLAGVADSG
jgi:hypothetical protein